MDYADLYFEAVLLLRIVGPVQEWYLLAEVILLLHQLDCKRSLQNVSLVEHELLDESLHLLITGEGELLNLLVLLDEYEDWPLCEHIRQFTQVDKVLTEFPELLRDAIVVREPVVSEIFSYWILDCVKPTESSIVAHVLPFSLIRSKSKKVCLLVLDHELVELVELLLCPLVIAIVLCVLFQKEILLVGGEQTLFILFASHQHPGFHVHVHPLRIVMADTTDHQRAHHVR